MKKGLKMSLKWENIMSECGLHMIDLILTHLDSYWGHVHVFYKIPFSELIPHLRRTNGLYYYHTKLSSP